MRQELDAIPAEAEGAALSRVQIEACMADGIAFARWICADDFRDAPAATRTAEALAWCRDHLAGPLKALDPDKRHVMGEDFARSGDATDIVIMEIGHDLVRRTKLIVELRNVPFDQQREVLFFVLDRVPRFVKGAMDRTGNGAWLAEVTAQRHGGRIIKVAFSQDWYRQQMPSYVAAFSDATVVLPRQIATTINRDLIAPFVGLNWGWDHVPPSVSFPVEDPEDLKALTDSLGTLVPLGLRVAAADVNKRIGFRVPDDGEPVLQIATAAPSSVVPDMAPGPERAHRAAAGETPPDEDPLDDDPLMSEALAHWEADIGPTVAAILAAARAADSYEAFLASLDHLSPDVDALAARLAAQMMKARGEGDIGGDIGG